MNDAVIKEIHTISKDVAIIKERQGNHIEQQDALVERVEAVERDLLKLLQEHAGVKGQMKMLSIIGGVLVGVAVIAEVVILVVR